MFDFNKVKIDFEEKCDACGLCVECCPIVSHTELNGVDPEKIIEEILDLFHHNKVGELARTRIYSCLYCNTCTASCPQGLKPGLSFGVGKKVLADLGDPVPEGVSSILKTAETLIEMVTPVLKGDPETVDRLITKISETSMEPVKTVLFSSCFGFVLSDVLKTAVKIIKRIDPAVKVFGGFDYCCGELQLIAGQPENAERQFGKLIDGLNALSPEKVVILCPTCNMNFDLHNPDTKWSWEFFTDYFADHLDSLGPLNEVNATVTVHDACHFVRGVNPGSDSPRRILNRIPGIKIIEMKNAGENSLCCGAYAISGAKIPGLNFRDKRLQQAKDTGADILSLYCPGCQMTLGPEAENSSLKIESCITLLGKSLGVI
jgi:Fe-S oxidoreductase